MNDFAFPNPEHEAFFDTVQNTIKAMITQKPYNVKQKDVEDFIDLMFDYDNNDDIINIVGDYADNNAVEVCAKKIIELRFKNTKVNNFLIPTENQYENVVSFKDFLKLR